MKDLRIPNIQNSSSVAGSSRKNETRPDAAEFKNSLAKALNEGRLNTEQKVKDLSESLKFSSHALKRLHDRGISMNKERMQEIEAAVDKVAAKGARESLVLTDEAAYIVSVENRTVITALDKGSMNGNVFTNIDSTILV